MWVTMKSETVTKKRGRKVRIVVIEVEEGFRSMVAGLEFSGNRTFDRETLMKDVLSRPSGLMSSGAFLKQTLSEDVQAVAAFYRKNGFPNVKVTDQVEWTTERENRIRLARIVIHVDEGAKFTLGSVRFSGLQGLNHKDALALLSQKKGGLYSSEGVAEDEKKLSAAISEKGYPHVTVPMGFVKRLPVGLSIFGAAGRDIAIMRIAGIFESALQVRRKPGFLPTLEN